METNLTGMTRQHIERVIKFSPDPRFREKARQHLASLSRPPVARASTATRPKAVRVTAPVAARPAVTPPVDLRGMSPEAMMMSVIGDPNSSPADQLRASRALTEYFRDLEITPEHRSQFEAVNQSMANDEEQRAFLARRCSI